MGLETGTYISDLNASNPINATDVVGQGDDHMRLIKSTLLNTFPNITGAMTLTHSQLNEAAIKDEANTFLGAVTIERNNSSSQQPYLKLFDHASVEQYSFDVTAADHLLITDASNNIPFQIVKASDVRLRDGYTLRVYDSADTDYIEVSVATNIVSFAGNGVVSLDLSGFANHNFAGHINAITGSRIRAYDSTDTDTVELYTNGTNGKLVGTNLQWLELDTWSSGLKLLDGMAFRLFDSSNVDYMNLAHNGVNLNATFNNTTAFNLLDGVELRVYDSTDTDYIGIKHDGTGAVWLANNVADMDFASIAIKSDNDTVDEPGWKGTPQNSISDNYTLVIGDAAKQIYMTAGAAKTLTIPANASVAFPIGTILTIVNDSGNDWTVAITTDTLEKLGGSTGSQTLTDNNKAVIEKVTSTLWKYSSTD